MSGIRMDVIGMLCRSAEIALAKFARGADGTRTEARLAMAMAIIADTPEAELPDLRHNLAMMIAARPKGDQLTTFNRNKH